MDKEIKYSDLTASQQALADQILSGYRKGVISWGRQSGKTFLAKYLEQEFRKLR